MDVQSLKIHRPQCGHGKIVGKWQTCGYSHIFTTMVGKWVFIDFRGLAVARTLKTQVFKSSLTFEPGMHLDRFSAKGALYAKVGKQKGCGQQWSGAKWYKLDGLFCMFCVKISSYTNGVSSLKVPLGDIYSNTLVQSNQRLLAAQVQCGPTGPFLHVCTTHLQSTYSEEGTAAAWDMEPLWASG